MSYIGRKHILAQYEANGHWLSRYTIIRMSFSCFIWNHENKFWLQQYSPVCRTGKPTRWSGTKPLSKIIIPGLLNLKQTDTKLCQVVSLLQSTNAKKFQLSFLFIFSFSLYGRLSLSLSSSYHFTHQYQLLHLAASSSSSHEDNVSDFPLPPPPPLFFLFSLVYMVWPILTATKCWYMELY